MSQTLCFLVWSFLSREIEHDPLEPFQVAEAFLRSTDPLDRQIDEHIASLLPHQHQDGSRRVSSQSL